jgi:hypothetical protein
MSCHSEPILVLPSAVEEPAARRERTASGTASKGEESRPRANGCLYNYTAKLKWSAISLDTPLDFDTTIVPITDWNPANVALNR